MINHGTYGGYQAHRRKNEDACEPCRTAARDYQRNYRSVVGIESQKRYSQAREQAFLRLSRMHPDEFHRLMHEELRRIPIESKPRRPRGTIRTPEKEAH